MIAGPAPLGAGPALPGTWTTVVRHSYGAGVYRVDGPVSYYVKTAPHWGAGDLRFDPAAEAARLGWLARLGIPVPEVVEVGADAESRWLVTVALPGVPASGPWPPAQRAAADGVVAELARTLHGLPIGDCPFTMDLSVTLAWAREAARTGKVDLADLDPAHAGWSAADLLAELDALPRPDEDLVVAHGDLTLDNVLITPEPFGLAGVLDTGRLGVADRWRDLAIVLRELAGDGGLAGARGSAELGPRARDFLRRYGLAEPCPERLAYYLLLDEFC